MTARVAKLKAEPGGELHVWGSSVLVHTLIEHDLIDEYRLLFYPLHLGTGKKLFTDSTRAAALKLSSRSVTSRGVIIASYEPDGPLQYGTMGEG